MNVSDASRLLNLRADVLARSDALRPASPAAPTSSFQEALNTVARLQDEAGSASEAMERGDMSDIAQVMIARQKASVAFEATLQVRNKLLGAYRDIMNMGM